MKNEETKEERIEQNVKNEETKEKELRKMWKMEKLKKKECLYIYLVHFDPNTLNLLVVTSSKRCILYV